MVLGRVILVAAVLGACGEEQATTKLRERDAVDASALDAGRAVAQGGSGGSDESAFGGAGAEAPEQPIAGMVAGGAGGESSQPMGGAGAPAPQERVLWSQTRTVEVHEAVAYGAVAGTKMALILDAGQLCRFGFMAADSGSTQEYETDGKCITAFSGPMGAAVFYAPSGSADGTAGRSELVGWKEAVQGHTVVRLRRTQTYETQVLGTDSEAWNYADFSGKWEALGY